METRAACSNSGNSKALNRTIVGWKHFQRLSDPFGIPTLNRTIVGWKHIEPRTSTRSRENFKSHHSGMETTFTALTYIGKVSFKSHHSGMETVPGAPVIVEFDFFKSHHSGMETGPRARGTTVPGVALNRTIVGWKHLQGQSGNSRVNPLNRTIVGWKQQYLLTLPKTREDFKSHHSGMETYHRSRPAGG